MPNLQFKYSPNAYENGVFSKAEGELPVCECCGAPTEYFYNTMYCCENVRCICPQCIASGKAAEKFDGQFIQDAEEDKVNDQEKYHELFKCTPGYCSWQGEKWLACCEDYCAFIGCTDIDILNEIGIADEVLKELDEYEKEIVRSATADNESIGLYLFRCLHCGKFHLGFDFD